MKKIFFVVLGAAVIAVGVWYVWLRPAPSVSQPETAPVGITQEQAVNNVRDLPEVQDYLTRVPGGIVDVGSVSDGHINVHVYEIKDGHTATLNWYQVSQTTGQIQPQF